MSIIRKIPWIRQPTVRTGINWGNPLTHGLVALWNAAEGGGDQPDLSTRTVYGGRGAAFASDTLITHVEFNEAWKPQLNSGLLGYRPTNDANVTFLDVVFGATVQSTADKTLFSLNQFHNSAEDSAIWGSPFSASFQIWADTASGALRLNIYDGVTVSSSSAGLLDDNNRVYQITITYDDSASDCLAYVDGIQEVSDTGFTPATNADDLRINTSESTSKSGDHSIYMLAIWDRVLTVGEVFALNKNPWQLFQPRLQYVPTEVVAVGGTTPHYAFGLPLYGPFAGPIG